MLVRFVAVLTAVLLSASPALASAASAVMNKEGFWAVDADGEACAATMTLQGGAVFLLRGYMGDVAVALVSKAVLPNSKTFGLEVDGKIIELPAQVLKEGGTIYLDGVLDAPSLASLRAARQARVLIDGRAVSAMTLEGTGFPGALDSLVACSQGKAGWWGKGALADDAPAADDFVFNAEDVWVLLPLDKSRCLAQAGLEDKKDLYLEFFQHGDSMTIAVLSHGPKLRRGQKGVLSLDDGDFDFKPIYPDTTVMIVDGEVTGDALLALRATKKLALRVDGKAMADVDLSDTGFPRILDELAACARGETGWWTPNARTSAAP